MDSTLLIDPAFWGDTRPFTPGVELMDLPAIPELAGHVLFQTSGSTGDPKLVALSKDALLLSAACVNRHLHVSEISRWGSALPYHHVGGFGIGARAFEAACDYLVFPSRWQPVDFSAWLAQEAITHTSLVPTQVYDLIKHELRAPSSLKAVVVGGGKLLDDLGMKARALGWPVLASYGMTETGSQIATQPLGLLEVSYQSGEISLLDIWEARTTESAILEVSGPALFSGYLRYGKGGSWTYDARNEDWHGTSDRVALNGRLLTPFGRADQIVKILGELVDPEEIERELVKLSCGGVPPNRLAVVAIPDERAEHRLIPVFEESMDRLLISRVLEDYNSQSAGFRRLQSPVFVKAIPSSSLGKILRQELRKFVSR